MITMKIATHLPPATKQRTLPKKTFSTIGIEIVSFVTFVAKMRKMTTVLELNYLI